MKVRPKPFREFRRCCVQEVRQTVGKRMFFVVFASAAVAVAAGAAAARPAPTAMPPTPGIALGGNIAPAGGSTS